MNFTDVIAEGFVSRQQSANTVGVQLVKHQLLTNGLAKVVATARSASLTPEIARAAIASATKARPVAGSFRLMPNHIVPTVVGFVTEPVDVRVLAAAELASYRVLSSNILMDESDSSLWEVQSADDGGNRRLVRKSSDSLGSLLQAACIDSPRGSSLVGRLGEVTASMVTASNANTHTYGSFVNPFTNTLNYGFFIGAGSDEQFERQGHSIEHPVEVVTIPEDTQTVSSMQTVVVPSGVVIEMANIPASDSVFASLATPNDSRAAMREYYKNVFKHAPDYFKRLSDIINNHSFA